MGLIVRYDFVARLVSASHVETSALVRDQLQVWLHHYGVEVLDAAVLLRNRKTMGHRERTDPTEFARYNRRGRRSNRQVGISHLLPRR